MAMIDTIREDRYYSLKCTSCKSILCIKDTSKDKAIRAFKKKGWTAMGNILSCPRCSKNYKIGSL